MCMNAKPEITEKGIRPKPLYAQIAEEMAQRIQCGELSPGDRLPSQNALMEEFSVSQATVRQAILNLSNQGLVTAHQGVGVFVAEPRISVELSQTSLEFGANSGTLSYEMISSDLLAAPDRMAKLLDIEPGENTIRCRRKLLVKGSTIGYETCNLPLDVMQTIPHHALTQLDLRQVLHRAPQWLARQGAFWVSAGQITAFDAEVIGASPDTIILQREDVTKDQNGRPILMTRSIFLADRVSLSGTSQMEGAGQ